MSDNNITRREEREQAFLICFEKLFINEAVELSKKFSGEDEYKFVNGVLGAIARDL